MSTLADICAKKREHIISRKAEMPESRLLEKIKTIRPPRGFKKVLEEKARDEEIGLIAEIKKASPSRGIIRSDFHPITLARDYEAGGATCISVLTDEPYFQGHDEYLKAARAASHLPILRKDFILDPYQVIESRMLGADCILLIMAAITDEQAKELNAAAIQLKMDVLFEVHDKAELDRAIALKPEMIGVNNRNLKTLKVNLATAESLSPHIPKKILAVCESGINTKDDITRMQKSGFYCFLVGGSLMREQDVKAATQRLLGTGNE